ncbi:MAG: DEAD/DEAH box helicase [Acidimicrobiales bacterium]
MDGAAKQASKVLLALADLAPSSEPRSAALAIPTQWFRWLPLDAVRLFLPGGHFSDDPGGAASVARRILTSADAAAVRVVAIDRSFGERLAAVDQIRPEQRSLRVGWLFVAGKTTTEDGRPRRVFHPLVTVTVRVERPPLLGSARLHPVGDAEISELVSDRTSRHQLESRIEFGSGALDGVHEVEVPSALLARLERLQGFARAVSATAGLRAHRIVGAHDSPTTLMRKDDLVIVAGVGVYAVHETGETSRASSLREWAGGSLDKWSAFHSLYVDPLEAQVAAVGAAEPVDSPFLLTPIQRDAVFRSRADPVTLISGAPGTGKSHTLAAIACEALARGEHVLVAAKSDATVDALLDLLERAPGPDPVVFGSSERREALATRLSGGQVQPVSDDAVDAAGRRLAAACSRRENLRAVIANQLRAEMLLTTAEMELVAARAIAPGLYDDRTDLDRVEALLRRVRMPPGGWFARRRQRKAWRALSGLASADLDSDTDELTRLLEVARAARVSRDLAARGGLELGALWEELRALDDDARNARAQWLAVESRSRRRLNRSTLPAVAALATALRSGRSARREQLSRLDDEGLTRALPLWVGTLSDVDDLLPPIPGLFDLAILDEASSIDQPLAAPALLRGRRAVIAGDPRQLRHVSFLSDELFQTVVENHGLAESPLLMARLDVRRNSAFDVAAGVVPVLGLDEHFRSHPHLVDFVATRLYGGVVKVATRSPRTESRDCIDVVRIDGQRDSAGVVRSEVDWVITELKSLLRAGVRSVGIVTPFRAQADALEAAALKAFTADDLEALDLRIGTVHAFQGNERDLIITSLGLGPNASAASWRFVEDPHLFSVFVTRARKRLRFLYSADPPEAGLVAGYLAQANSTRGRPKAAGTVGRWTAAIAADLASAGLPISIAYPSGRHVVDVCLDDHARSTGIECEVHRDGADAHIERHLALHRAGWDLLDAYQSRWGDRRGELVVNLIGRLKATHP